MVAGFSESNPNGTYYILIFFLSVRFGFPTRAYLGLAVAEIGAAIACIISTAAWP